VIVGACFSVTPQVHAFDDDSLVENLAAQQDAVESALAFLGGKPLHISPVTFRMQSNPEPDPRQETPFGAGWTLGSIKYLSQGGAASISYSGAKGFQRQVFGHVAEFAGGEVLISESTRPLEFDGLVLRKGGRMRILLASFSPEPISVRLATDRLGRRAIVDTEPVEISGHWLEIALRPYAIVRIDT
jgi:hypothetical protein